NLSIEGKATQALARQLALAVVNEMKVPRWGLAESLDALELYEALEKKFAQTKPAKSANAADALADLENSRFGDGYEKQLAKTYYLMALIVRGRTVDAAQFARRATEEGGEFQVESAAVAALERAGSTAALDTFLHDLLATAPKAAGRNTRRFRAGARQSVEWDNHALTLARLGHLLEKPEWVAEGLAAAMPKPDANANPGDEYADAYQTRILVEVLVQV